MSTTDTSIIYLTDNCLDDTIAQLVRRNIVREAGDIPIVSVSQEPIELGKNVCVGKIGRSWSSIHRQLLEGLQAAASKFVSIAEHDCLYTHEHFAFIPETDDEFWCNSNCWLIEHKGNHPDYIGTYSYWPKRSAMSQQIVAREFLIGYCKLQMERIEASEEAKRIAASGTSRQLQRYVGLIEGYRTRFFQTKFPNIDIRHGGNFTGPKRGKLRRRELPYWGKWEDVTSDRIQ